MSRMGRIALELQEHGFETIEEAEANGYELIDTTLYKTAERALQEEKDEQLDKLDEVIAYLKDEVNEGIKDIYKKNKAYELLDKLKDVEKYIKERS